MITTFYAYPIIPIGIKILQSDNGIAHHEFLSGVDGVNKIFITSYEYVPSSTNLELNGLQLKLGRDYYEQANEDGIYKQILMISAPQIDGGLTDELFIEYRRKI